MNHFNNGCELIGVDDHGSDRVQCPLLPLISSRLRAASTRELAEKNGAFYHAALSYAQSLWLEGKPAQAILQLNKAWMADLRDGEEMLKEYPAPYQALRWIMRRAKSGEMGFMGNPVRHFQHLASRMSGPRAEVRSWRAWACFHIACCELEDRSKFPLDGVQLVREGLWIPGCNRVMNEIHKGGWNAEGYELEIALSDLM